MPLFIVWNFLVLAVEIVQSSTSVAMCPSLAKDGAIVEQCTFDCFCRCPSVTNDTVLSQRKTNYYNTMIVLYNIGSPKIANLLESISCCGNFRTVQYNFYNEKMNKLKNFCKQPVATSLRTIVLDTRSDILVFNNTEMASVGQCGVSDLGAVSKFLSTVLQQCNKILLVSKPDVQAPPTSMIKFDAIENVKAVPPPSSNYKITFSYTSYLPFINRTVVNGKMVYSGMLWQMMKTLERNLNYTFEIVEPLDDNFGSLENGTWNGLIGMVITGDTDIAVSTLSVSLSRMKAIDFTTAYQFEMFDVLMKKPEAKGSMMDFARAMAPNVWALFIGAMFLAMIIIYILRHLSIFEEDPNVRTFAQAAWYIYSAQMNQQADRVIHADSGRTFEIFWRLGAFLVLSIYTGGLYAALTTRSALGPFRNIDQLADALLRNDYKVCLVKSTSLVSLIQLADDDSTYGKINKWLKKNPDYLMSETECVQRMLNNPDVGFITQKTRLKLYQALHCHEYDLVLLNDLVYSSYLALAVKKQSPLGQKLSSEIEKFLAEGLLLHWYRNYTVPILCLTINSDNVYMAASNAISMFNLAGLFFIFAGGSIIGATVFMGELYMGYRKRCKKIKENSSSVLFVSRKDLARREIRSIDTQTYLRSETNGWHNN